MVTMEQTAHAMYHYNGSGWVLQYPVYYGTGAPPAAAGKPDGSLFFKYIP
jgi:hypothetical protein